MTSKVYLINTVQDNKYFYDNILKIIEKTGFYDKLTENEKIAIKIHLRDITDSEYINKKTLDKIRNNILFNKANCFLVDTDNLYHKNKENLNSIIKYMGYSTSEVLIDETVEEIDVDKCEFKIPILKNIINSDKMIVISHFKGHSMIGFSGALKNIATGCTNIDGKIMLHKTVKPFISKIACLACNECVISCPENAITLNSVAKINSNKCTGCNRCISSCPKDAIKLNKITSQEYMKNLSNFSYACLKNKKDNKVLFINILTNIKPYYDCKHDTDKVITNDIGIVASFDPVSIDKASYDLVNFSEKNNSTNFKESIDKFREIWRNVDGTLQFKYAEEIKIGTSNYELIKL